MATLYKRWLYDDDYASHRRPDELSRRHRSHHHQNRSHDPILAPLPDQPDAGSPAEGDMPDMDELRRVRADYYSKMPDEKNREARRHRRVAQDSEVLSPKASSTSGRARGSSDGREHRRRRRDRAAKHPDQVSVIEETYEEEQEVHNDQEEGSDGGVFVYSKEVRARTKRDPAVAVDSMDRPASSESEHREMASENQPGLTRPPRKARRPASVVSTVRVRTRSSTKSERERARHNAVVQRRPPRLDMPAAPDPPDPTKVYEKPARSVSMSQRRPAQEPKHVLRRSKTTSNRPPPAPDPPVVTESHSGRATGGRTHATTAERRRSSGFFNALFAPPPPPKPERKVTCLTCMADDIPASKSAKLACGHRMCHGCLKRIFKMSVKDPQHMPPRCCTQDHIPLKFVERLFAEDFKRLWNKKYEEYTTSNRVYCPSRGCGEWIKPSRIKMDARVGRKVATCKLCHTKVCVLCNCEWHGRKDCPNDEETKRFVAVAKEKGWQRCYSCKAMVELKEGCNHMTCRCNAEFCMICGRPWKTCDCPWFNAPPECPPFDRLNHMVLPVPVGHPYYPHHHHHPPPPPPPPDQMAHIFDRRAQERADEEVAMRLQRSELSGVQTQREIDLQLYGLGNAATHHMNENFRMRSHQHLPMPPPPPPPPAMPQPSHGEDFTIWPPRPPRRARRPVPSSATHLPHIPHAPNPPTSNSGLADASTMAGLSLDGSRTGANRVGGWLQHVEEGASSNYAPSIIDEEVPRVVGARERQRLARIFRSTGYVA